MHGIKSDPKWLAAIMEKAKEKGLPIDVMLKRDAGWVITNAK